MTKFFTVLPVLALKVANVSETLPACEWSVHLNQRPELCEMQHNFSGPEMLGHDRISGCSCFRDELLYGLTLVRFP